MFKKSFYLIMVLVLVASMSLSVFSQENEVELVIWDVASSEARLPQLIKEFEEKNPGIKVRAEYFPWSGMVDKYLVALKGGGGPDIVSCAIDWVSPFAKMGLLAPIDEFIAADKMDMSDFFEGPLQTTKLNGKMYALPYRSDTVCLFFNKKIFKEAGLNPDKAPETWSQLLEYAKVTTDITKDDVFGFGLVGVELTNMTTPLFVLVLSNGGSILNKDNTKSMLNEPAAIEAANFLVDMYRKYKVTPKSTMENDATANRNLFASEKVAMIMGGYQDIEPIFKANPNIQMGVAVQPKWKITATILGGWNLALTNTSKNKDAAWKFIKFMSSTEISPRYSSTFPSRKSAMKDEKYNNPNDPYQNYKQTFLNALNYAFPTPRIPQMVQIRQIVYDQMQYALMGEKTAEQAMNDAVKEIDLLLK